MFTVFVNGFEDIFYLLLPFVDSGDTITLISIEEMIKCWYTVTFHKSPPKSTGVLLAVTSLGNLFFACYHNLTNFPLLMEQD